MTTQVVLPLEEALSTISGLDELTLARPGGQRAHHAASSCSSATSRARPRTCARRWRGRSRDLPPNILPPDHPEGGPRRRPGAHAGGGGRPQPARDDRDRRQADQARPGDGRRRGRGQPDRRAPAPDPRLRGRRQARRLRPHDHRRRAARSRTRTSRSPAARIVRGDAELGVRTLGRLDAVSQFGDIIVRERRRHARSASATSAASRTASPSRAPGTCSRASRRSTLDVRRQSGTNTVKIIDAIKEQARPDREDAARRA